jgi:hypothetical protein
MAGCISAAQRFAGGRGMVEGARGTDLGGILYAAKRTMSAADRA